MAGFTKNDTDDHALSGLIEEAAADVQRRERSHKKRWKGALIHLQKCGCPVNPENRPQVTTVKNAVKYQKDHGQLISGLSQQERDEVIRRHGGVRQVTLFVNSHS